MALGKYESILKRYQQGFIRDDQLRRYWELGCITDEQYIYIYQTKYSGQYPEGLEPEVEQEPIDESIDNVSEEQESDKESEENADLQQS